MPIGEVITALLRFGLKAYDNGLLNLEPVQKPDLHIGFGWHEMNFTQK
ncbi:MAG: hypothetical protein IPN58_04425 [Anaerolineales bacterium]|nr:hypothetical protein [Anaerolineales bacterium]